MNADRITVWTIQTALQWELLQRHGILSCDGRRIAREMRPVYSWMMKQLRTRIPGSRGQYPIWVWAKPRPDLRWSGHLPPGTRGIRLECYLPRRRVLLSDFDRWHIVLNGQYLAMNEQDWNKHKNSSPRTVKKSWKRIFDLSQRRATTWNGPLTHIQGVVESITLDEVVSVRPFLAR